MRASTVPVPVLVPVAARDVRPIELGRDLGGHRREIHGVDRSRGGGVMGGRGRSGALSLRG